MNRSLARPLARGALWLLLAVPTAGAAADAPPPPEADAAVVGATDAAPAESADAGAPAPGAARPVSAETPWDVIGSDPVGRTIRTAWSLPAATLDERVERTLRAGLTMGFRDLEAPARALLFAGAAAQDASPLERARAAARLAPDLPAARAALALALLREGGHPLAAAAELLRAVERVPRHLEAWMWARATGLDLLALAAVAGGLLFLAVAGGALLPVFGRHLLGGLKALPPASRFAAVAALVLLPVLFGEGLLGIALALTALGFAYGTPGRRLAVGAAAALLVAGLHPLAEAAARARTAPVADPTVLAASAAEVGLPTAAELARVVRHAAHDPVAARAVALRDKRAGRLARARAAYEALLAQGKPDARLLNNAANAALALDRHDEAIALYEAAVAAEPGPAILFNLSQAYGRAVRLDAQDLALAQAQELDAEVVAELTDLFSAYSSSAVVDLPVDVGLVAPRLVDARAAGRLAEAFRRRVAPAGAGRDLAHTGALFAGAALAGLVLGFALRRIAGEVADDDHYADLARLLQRRGTDPGERMRRLDSLRARQARVRRLQIVLAFVVPGVAGLLARRPALALLGAASFAGAATLLLRGASVVPDPLAVGPLAPALVALGAGTLGLVYVVQLGVSLALREKS